MAPLPPRVGGQGGLRSILGPLALALLLLIATLGCGIRPPDDGAGVADRGASPVSVAQAPETPESALAPPTDTPTPAPTPIPTLILPPGATPAGTGVAASPGPVSVVPGTPSVPDGTPSSSPPGPAAVGAPPSATPAPERVRVATIAQGANLRREPGTGGVVLGTVGNGVELIVIGPDRSVGGQDWRNVRAPDGDEGWIVGAAVETIATPVPPPTPPPSAPTPTPTPDAPAAVAAPEPVVVVTATSTAMPERAHVADPEGANLRAEPGTSGQAIKPLREGAELTVIGPDREVAGQVWRNVRDATGDEGWVVGEAVASLPPAAAPAAESAPASVSASSSLPPDETSTEPSGDEEPSAAPDEDEAEPTATPDAPAAPCRTGQVKGDATSGLYYVPDHPDYAAIRERVRCFDAESRARASGFLPAPEDERAPEGEATP